ncbi:putative necrosis-inducing factor domain containing protein [Naviculisporaceae sp. PSN 640]
MTLRTLLASLLLPLGSLYLANGSPVGPEIAQARSAQPVHRDFNITLTTTTGHHHHCGGYTYENQNSPGSPLISDCRQLMTNIDKDGEWTVWADSSSQQIASYGTCAYDVRSDDPHWVHFWVGNGDIIDTITDSINQLGWNGLIGASGTMWCRTVTPWDAALDITFGIYHT